MQAFLHSEDAIAATETSPARRKGAEVTARELLSRASSTPLPFFDKIRCPKNLGSLIRRIRTFNPQDMPD